MKQRINLYRPVKRSKKFNLYSLSGTTTVVVAVLVLALLLGGGLQAYAIYQQDKFAQLKTEKKALDAAVETEQARFSNQKVNPDILEEQERIKTEIAARKQLLRLLHKVQPEHRASFSSYLFSLAVASQPESWVTAFTIDANERSFHLSGAASNGPAVPLMLEEIGNTEAFQRMSIESLDVEVVDEETRFKAMAELRFND